MNNKKYVVLKLLVVILVVFIIVVTAYKIVYETKETVIGEKIFDVGDIVRYEYNTNYVEKYKDKIIYFKNSEIEYSIATNDRALYGKVFIGNDDKLYISDEIINKNYLILDKEIKTIYSKKYDILCSVYAITKNGELYHIGLADASISSLHVDKLVLPSPVTNFTELDMQSFLVDNISVVVLAENGIMYDAITSTQYNDNVILIYDKYIVYDDRNITNFKGNILNDENNNPYRVKTILLSYNPISKLRENPEILIITNDDKLIYLLEDDKVYEYYSKVSDIVMDKNQLIKITFENNDVIEFEGYYDKTYFSTINYGEG